MSAPPAGAPPRPRALLLDLDGTLMDHEGAARDALLRVMRGAGLASQGGPQAAVAQWKSLEREHFQRYLDGEITFEAQRLARVGEFLASHGVQETDPGRLLAWFEGYRVHYEDSWNLYPDVAPLLHGVRTRGFPVRLAVVTNGDAGQQAEKMRRLGLVGTPLFASSAVGTRKPAPGIFLHACRSLEVAPSDAWFVGDDRDADAIGACRAGLRGIWLDRSADQVSDAAPDRVASLLGVLRWLDEAHDRTITMTPPERASGTVALWNDDEGWGVVASADTPGGCWVHFSHIVGDGFRILTTGEAVSFTFERLDPGQEQNGFTFRALRVTTGS